MSDGHDPVARLQAALVGGGFSANGHEPITRVAGEHLNVLRFLAEHGEGVRFARELNHWLVWNGGWWEEDRTERVEELGRVTIDALRSWVDDAPDDHVRKERHKHYLESTRVARRDGMLRIARTNRTVAVRVDDLDRYDHFLACANGTVDLRTGELRPADPDDLVTRGVGVEYNPDARSDEWDTFLGTIFAGDDDLVGYARRLVGYAATGDVGEHILPIFWGTGANGKSSFVTALMGVLGSHAAVAPEGLLTESKHEQHPERLAALRGRRLVVSSELEQRAVLAEGLVKSITGGDRISARHLYGSRFEFEPTHTMILVTNHPPKVKGTDEAIWRRLVMVPFTVTIPAEQRIHGYGRRLVERCAAAILAWIVAGSIEWHAGGLGTADQVRRATQDYRAREDVFAEFLEECTVPVEGARTPLKQLHEAWRGWAKSAGVAVGRAQDFSAWLGSHGVTLGTRQGTRFVDGVGIVSDRDDTGSDQQSVGAGGSRPGIAHTRARAHDTRAHGQDLEEPSRAPTDPSSEPQSLLDDRESQPW